MPVAVVLLCAIPFYYSKSPWLDIAFMVVALALIAWSCGTDVRGMLLSKIIKTHGTTK